MIKNIRLFINNNPKSIKYAKITKEELLKHDFNVINDENFDLGIAIGGDGSFLRMVRQSNFNSNPYYIGINTGHLGFLQEVKMNELNLLINELQQNKYQIDDIGIQETIINSNEEYKYYSLNEILVRDENLGLFLVKVYIDDNFLEQLAGEGIMLVTSTGSTAYNLSHGGSIVYPSFSTLQITSMACINSKRYRGMTNSIIIPSKMKVRLVPKNKRIIIAIDGENHIFNGIESITSSIEDKKIKVLRLSHYNFPEKINKKLLAK